MDFPTTHWTALAQATLNGDERAGRALEDFILRYRRPVMSLLRRRGLQNNRVEDLTHDFFIQLMEKSSLRRATPVKGRFRCFLSGALRHFLADDLRHHSTIRRGGETQHLSLDAAGDIAATEEAMREGEALFLDREWALNIMESALEELRREWAAADKGRRWEALRAFLPGAMQPADCKEAAQRTGLSDAALRKEVSRLRSRFRDLVRLRVASTVSSPLDVDDELAHLQRVLTAPGTAAGDRRG